MWRKVSSTNLALLYKRNFGIAPLPVIISHTDTDSILASGILSGILLYTPKLAPAAIAADHTGNENQIADLLQPLEEARDIALSFASLFAFLNHHRLPKEASFALQKRRAQRALARKAIKNFEDCGNGIWYGLVDEAIPSELFYGLLPRATIIVLASKMKDTDKWEIKTRAGQLFPRLRSLHELNLSNWGGRWNAGSTKRDGGVNNPDQFLKQLLEAYQRFEIAK
jgi:hypothetical protein